jgi:hypothetical protein
MARNASPGAVGIDAIVRFGDDSFLRTPGSKAAGTDAGRFTDHTSHGG